MRRQVLFLHGEAEGLHGSVLRARGFEFALDQMEFRGVRAAEFVFFMFRDYGAQLLWQSRAAEPREREVRSERTFFPGESQRRERGLNAGSQLRQRRGRVDSGPKNSWVMLAGKEAESAKVQLNRSWVF